MGIGETYRDLKVAAVRRNAAALMGKNALDLNLASLDLPDKGSYAGFEMALYDIVSAESFLEYAFLRWILAPATKQDAAGPGFRHGRAT